MQEKLRNDEIVKKYAQNTMSFSKHVKTMLTNLRNLKEWTDIVKWLEKLLNLLKEMPTPFIVDKLLLSRGLAQCLNPNLNSGVHKLALKAYNQIFQNLALRNNNWAKDLGVYAHGLFSFCKYCSVKVKIDLIKIFSECFLPLGVQLCPCAPGLLASIFPFFEENDEEIKNESYKLIEGVRTRIGNRYFFNSCWMALSRSPESRNSILKYLNQEAKQKIQANSNKLSSIVEGSELEDQSLIDFDLTQGSLNLNNDANNQGRHSHSSVGVEPLKKLEIQYEEDNEEDLEGGADNLEVEIGLGEDIRVKENEIGVKIDEGADDKKGKLKASTVNFEIDVKNDAPQAVISDIEDIGEDTEDQDLPSNPEQDSKLTQQAIQVQNGLDNKKKELTSSKKQNILQEPEEVEEIVESKETENEINPSQSKDQNEQRLKDEGDQSKNQSKEKVTKEDEDLDDDFDFLNDNEKIVSSYNPSKLKAKRSETFHKFTKQVAKDNQKSSSSFDHGPLVVNATINCLNDSNKLIKRGILDCLLLKFQLNSDAVFTKPQKIALVQAVLTMLVRRDLSITRRLYSWLFGEPDIDNRYNLESHMDVVELIVLALVNLFQVKTHTSEDETLKPIKILQNFYMEHQDLIKFTLQSISDQLLTYINSIIISLSNEEHKQNILKNVMRFMASIASNFYLILESINSTIDKVANGDFDDNLDQKNQELLTCYKHLNLLFRIWREEELQGIENREEISKLFLKISLKLFNQYELSNIFELFIECQYKKLEIVMNISKLSYKILSSLRKSKERDSFDLELNTIMGNGNREVKDDEFQFKESEFKQEIDKFEAQFTNLASQYMNIKVNQTYVTFMKGSGDREYLDSELPASYLKIFRYLVLLVTQIQHLKYDKDEEVPEQSKIPGWLIGLTNCIKSNEPNICNSSIEGLIFVISTSRTEDIYCKLREALQLYVGLNQGQDAESDKKRGQSITELVIEKLWELLDFHSFHKMAINMLNEMNIFVPKIVEKSITSTLEAKQYDKKEKAFQRFCTFWKLTSSDPVLASQSHKINRLGLFMMLDFLDDENPLLRHAAKNWLKHSIDIFQRILDPIFEELCSKVIWYQTDTQQYFYANIFDTDSIFSCFKKIKNIMISIPEIFSRFICDTKLTPEISKTAENLMESRWLGKEETTYFQLIIVISLRYIQGQALQSLSVSFATECQKINSIACEILELFTVRIKEKSASVAEYVYEPLLLVESHAIMNKNYVIQVQLLSLLKIILFDKSMLNSSENKDRMRELLSRPLLTNAIVKGLSSPSPYVLSQYINFLNFSLDPICSVLDFKDTKEFILRVVGMYQHLLSDYALQGGQEQEDDDENGVREILNNGEGNSQDYELSKDGTKRGLFDSPGGSQKDSNQQELIVCLVQGLHHIFEFFLDIETARKFSGPLIPQSGNVMRYLSLGLVGSRSNKTNRDKETFESIARSLLKNLKESLKVMIKCWIISKKFNKNCQISNYGTRNFNYEESQKISLNMAGFDTERSHGFDIRESISNILRPLLKSYQHIVLDSFIEIWISGCKYTQYPPEHHEQMTLKKVIEILITVGVKVQEFLDYLPVCRRMRKIIQYYDVVQKTGSDSSLNQKIADYESRLMFMLYCFGSYSRLNYIEDSKLRRDFLLKLWTSLIQFLKMFRDPQHPSTSCWTLEVYYLFSNKYLPQDLMDIRVLRSELHYHLNGLLVQMSEVISKDFKVLYKSSRSEVSLTVVPLSPSIYEQYYSEVVKRQKQGFFEEDESKLSSDHFDQLFDFVQYSEGTLRKRYRLYTIKTLENICMETFKNCYAVNRAERIASRTKAFMDNLFPLLEIERDDSFMVEYISSLIFSILDNSSQFVISQFQKVIEENFSRSDFFECSKENLSHWVKIVRLSVEESKRDVLLEFLNKISFSSVFAGEQEIKKKRIMAFTRMCFILYSVQSENFVTRPKMKSLVEKMKEIFRDEEEKHQSLKLLILFVFRILILRLPKDSVDELMLNMWPFLLTCMMQIFRGEKNGYLHLNLKYEALKLLELISICKFEHFYIHQWIFIYDYYGVQLVREEDPKEVEGFPCFSGFDFEPSLSNLMPKDSRIEYQGNISLGGVDTQKEVKAPRTELLLRESRINSEEELRSMASQLLQALVEENEVQMDISMDKVEEAIFIDFRALDKKLIDSANQLEIFEQNQRNNTNIEYNTKKFQQYNQNLPVFYRALKGPMTS